MLGVHNKQPEDTLDYDIEFSRWLPEGDSIQAASAIATTGVTVESVVLSGTEVKVWLSGGEDGATYTVEVTAETAGGRVKETCFKLRVSDRC